MMFTWKCPKCGFEDDSSKYYWRCPRCGSPLNIEFERKWRPRGTGLRRYSSMLPTRITRSLGEGLTPVVKRRVMGVNIWFKLEYLNPTGSFKDRGALVSLAYARSLGYKVAVEDTSGNTGIAVAAYSRLYRLKPVVYMPSYAPRGKKLLIRSLGGAVIETPDRGAAADAVIREASNPSIFYVAHTWSPLFIEGVSTIAYEAYESGFREGTIVALIGSGTLILGLYHGFAQLAAAGVRGSFSISYLGVQGYSCQPVYEAIHGRRAPGGDSSLADGIMVPSPPRLMEIASVIRKMGRLILVDNTDIKIALKRLYKMGFIVEPTSAAAFAALTKAIDDRVIDKGENVLLILTGSGLKVLDAVLHIIYGPLIKRSTSKTVSAEA